MTLTDGTVLKNKHNTEYGFGQQLSQPPAGVTGAAPTRRRHGADPPRRSAEAVARPPLPVQEQGVFSRGTASFCARAGNFRTRARKFLRDSGHAFDLYYNVFSLIASQLPGTATALECANAFANAGEGTD